MKNHTRRIHWWLSAIVVVLVVAGCGRTAELSSAKQDAKAVQNGTPTLTDPQKGATEEARQVIYDEAVRNDIVTLTALAIPTLDPASTMEPINDIPAPTRGFGIFSAFECSGEPKPKPAFLSNNCWHGQINSQDVYVTAGREGLADDPNQPVQGGIRVQFYISKYEVDENIHWTPTKSGALEIMSVNGAIVELRSVKGTTFIFNLETRQWVDANGTSIATTIPPSPMATSISGK